MSEHQMQSQCMQQGEWLDITNPNLKPKFVIVALPDGFEHRTVLAINHTCWIRVGMQPVKIYLFDWREDIDGFGNLPLSVLNDKYS